MYLITTWQQELVQYAIFNTVPTLALLWKLNIDIFDL